MTRILRIATRKSPLALWQAHYIGDLLREHWPELRIELVPLVTSGDQFLTDKLLVAGGKGLFVKELEDALLTDKADIAVHSMKDVPAEFPTGLTLPVICVRHNPLDAFVSLQYARLKDLPQGATVGTSSLRRQSQLLALRPDLNVKTLRGNIGTRLEKLANEPYDAIILAAAGLERMSLHNRIGEILPENIMLPACGQGALGIECRLNDDEILRYIAPLNDPIASLCVKSERQVNAQLGGNCHVPLAVFCQPSGDENLTLRAKVASPDGRCVIEDSQHGPKHDAMVLANSCAQALLAKGAERLLNETPHANQ